MEQTIKEDDHVVLMKSFDSGNMKIIPVTRDTIIYYGKLHFDPSPLIGAKFGSVFRIKDKTMTIVEDFELYDANLSTEVSSRLATFSEKSDFSKEKIIKRKKKLNHANIVTVIRPSLALINEMLYARDKIGGLRADLLSQILTSSNVQSGTKCLLLDHNLGMMTSAVMSRILPNGTCIQLLTDQEAICTTRKTLGMLNIREADYRDRLLSITIRDLYKVYLGTDNFPEENEMLRNKSIEHQMRVSELPFRTIRNPETGEKTKVQLDKQEQDELRQIWVKKAANREARNQERSRASTLLKQKSLDALILIAQNDHPLPILKTSYDFLAPSRQFVIYSDTIEPLLECHQYLKANCLAVSLSLSESWLRRFQVLPDRTRPEMNVSGFGGYLLSGTKALFGENLAKDGACLDDQAMEQSDSQIES